MHVEITKTITYPLMAANFFLLFCFNIVYFYCYVSIDPSVGRHLCFERDKKRYTGHIVFMSPCYRRDKGTSM